MKTRQTWRLEPRGGVGGQGARWRKNRWKQGRRVVFTRNWTYSSTPNTDSSEKTPTLLLTPSSLHSHLVPSNATTLWPLPGHTPCSSLDPGWPLYCTEPTCWVTAEGTRLTRGGEKRGPQRGRESQDFPLPRAAHRMTDSPERGSLKQKQLDPTE